MVATLSLQQTKGKSLGLFSAVDMPSLNPLMYTLRNEEVTRAPGGLLGRAKSSRRDALCALKVRGDAPCLLGVCAPTGLPHARQATVMNDSQSVLVCACVGGRLNISLYETPHLATKVARSP